MNRAGFSIGLYRADITPIDRLLRTTVGRRHMLDDIVEKLERNAKKRGGQHYLFIGPRGIGKTHLLTLIENEAVGNEKLKNLYTVIRFPEENNRILSFADLLLGVLDILSEKEDDSGLKELHHKLSQVEKDEDIIDTIVPRLRRYGKETGKTLLIMMENLDTLFGEQIKREQDIHRFRSFLMDSPCAALIGTSPVYFPGLLSLKSPLYDFFDIATVEDLSEEDTIELIRRNLDWEQRQDILKDFDRLIPKIKALYTLTGGNPRLTVMLYELIAHDNLMDVKEQFQMLLDQISPFYQDRLKELAPQERAVLETIALMRDAPRTPANIAARMRMKPQQVSSLLKRMNASGYLTVSDNPDDKRSRLYCIKEGFFDLWLAMSESRLHRRRLTFLSRFFEVYYTDRMERERKRQELWEKIDNKSTTAQKNTEELLGYLSDLGDESECAISKMEIIAHKIGEGDREAVGEYLRECREMTSRFPALAWMSEQAGGWLESGPATDVQKWLDDMVEYWRSRRGGDLEKVVDMADHLANDLSGRRLHKVYVELLTDTLRHIDRPEKKIPIHLRIASSLKMDGQLDEALDQCEKALKISIEIGDKVGEGAVLSDISQIYYLRGDYEKALTYLEQSLAISRQIGDKAGLCATLFNRGQIYMQNDQLQDALNAWAEAYVIAKPMNLAQVLQALADLAPRLGLSEGLAGWETLASGGPDTRCPGREAPRGSKGIL
jgi:tetratricopeptide (TPR) repeat protein